MFSAMLGFIARVRIGAAVTLGIVLAAALVAVPTSADASGSPMRGAPKAGQCYKVSGRTAAKAASTSKRAVSCRKRHTLWIVGVKKVPAGITLGHFDKNKAYWKFESKTCNRAYRHAIGRLDKRIGLSSYARYTFVASKSQRAQGARWLSCEIGVYGGRNKLVANRLHKPARLSMHPSNLARLCGTRHAYLTSCATKHYYRVGRITHVYSAKPSNYRDKALRFCMSKHIRGDWMYAYHPITSRKYVASCLPKNRH